jgi:hypothetical protein
MCQKRFPTQQKYQLALTIFITLEAFVRGICCEISISYEMSCLLLRLFQAALCVGLISFAWCYSVNDTLWLNLRFVPILNVTCRYVRSTFRGRKDIFPTCICKWPQPFFIFVFIFLLLEILWNDLLPYFEKIGNSLWFFFLMLLFNSIKIYILLKSCPSSSKVFLMSYIFFNEANIIGKNVLRFEYTSFKNKYFFLVKKIINHYGWILLLIPRIN